MSHAYERKVIYIYEKQQLQVDKKLYAYEKKISLQMKNIGMQLKKKIASIQKIQHAYEQRNPPADKKAAYRRKKKPPV